MALRVEIGGLWQSFVYEPPVDGWNKGSAIVDEIQADRTRADLTRYSYWLSKTVGAWGESACIMICLGIDD